MNIENIKEKTLNRICSLQTVQKAKLEQHITKLLKESGSDRLFFEHQEPNENAKAYAAQVCLDLLVEILEFAANLENKTSA